MFKVSKDFGQEVMSTQIEFTKVKKWEMKWKYLDQDCKKIDNKHLVLCYLACRFCTDHNDENIDSYVGTESNLTEFGRLMPSRLTLQH